MPRRFTIATPAFVVAARIPWAIYLWGGGGVIVAKCTLLHVLSWISPALDHVSRGCPNS